MPKNIVFLADGTWQSPKEPTTTASALDTNVVKLRDVLVNDGITQSVIYDDGLGIEFPKVLGGAFGVGIFGKIKQGYSQIAAVFKPGDSLYFFGFSRGAYTARCLAGMVSKIGVPTALNGRDYQTIAEMAFEGYEHSSAIADLAPFQMTKPTIKMQGVWDTVASLGFSGSLLDLKDPLVYGFLDTDLHEDTEAAYHALAIDERRWEFRPTLWGAPVTPTQIVEQVWFVGVHSEVGGGAQDTELSRITLNWMMKNAEAHGALLTADADPYRSVDPTFASDRIQDSWHIWCGPPVRRPIDPAAKISNSVALRAQRDNEYRPSNLKFEADGALASTYTVEPVLNLAAAAPAS